MRRNPLKLVGPFLALVLVASACGGDGGRGSAPENDTLTELRESDAGDVEPPERADAKDFAQPGLLLETNSATWRDLTDSPTGRGAVVLFVQPGGPSDRKGIARGDLITEVDGVPVANDEYALTLLRSNKGEARKIKLESRNGRERELEIKGDIPRQKAKPFLDGLIKTSPNDPVLRYMRARSGGSVSDVLADLEAALKEEPRFVDALALKGNVIFNRRIDEKDKDRQVAYIGEALAAWRNALDIDPKHAEALALQSAGQAALRKFDQAKSDAAKAVNIDGTLAVANHALARAELGLKKPANAAGPARAAVEANPYSNLNYYRTLAEVFRALKREDDCAATLNAIVPHLEGSKVPALKKEAEQLKKEAKESCD